MRYLPHTEEDISKVLKYLGIQSIDELFSAIPQTVRESADITSIPSASEIELEEELNVARCRWHNYLSFVGAGLSNHHVPSAVNLMLSRGEFFSAYTPYQPEASQGTLQAIFEFQSMVSELMGMDVANASMYDGASATAEAILMAARINAKRNTVLISEGIHPEYLETVRTYLSFSDIIIKTVALSDGSLSPSHVKQMFTDDVIAMVIQSPNYYGVIEEQKEIFNECQSQGIISIAVTTEPISLALLAPPGEVGADIAVAEGTGLGIPPHFGGPGLGLFSIKDKYVRKMPGRLVGKTVDNNGQRGFVLTLSTREQHIRREKATSNICTNHGLMALAAAVYIALHGPQGLKELALQNAKKAHYAVDAMQKAGVSLYFAGKPFFNEFTVKLNKKITIQELENLTTTAGRTIIPGVAINRFNPEMADGLLIQITERHSKKDIEDLVQCVAQL